MTDLIVKDLLWILDDTRDRTLTRLGGLSDAEYLWEPFPDSVLTVRPDSADVAAFRADPVPEPDPVPAPVPTIAWRMWHIGADCLRGYRENFFGVDLGNVDWPAWPGSAAAGVRALADDWTAFRDDVAGFDDERLLTSMGPRAGRYAEFTYQSLVLHAIDEAVHHSAELGLLRDFYPRR